MSDTWPDTIKSMSLYNNPAHKNHHYPTLTGRSLKKRDYLRNPCTHYFLKNINLILKNIFKAVEVWILNYCQNAIQVSKYNLFLHVKECWRKIPAFLAIVDLHWTGGAYVQTFRNICVFIDWLIYERKLIQEIE